MNTCIIFCSMFSPYPPFPTVLSIAISALPSPGPGVRPASPGQPPRTQLNRHSDQEYPDQGYKTKNNVNSSTARLV